MFILYTIFNSIIFHCAVIYSFTLSLALNIVDHLRCGVSFFLTNKVASHFMRSHLLQVVHLFSHSLVDNYCCSQCQVMGKPCVVSNLLAQRLLTIGNSLPQLGFILGFLGFFMVFLWSFSLATACPSRSERCSTKMRRW